MNPAEALCLLASDWLRLQSRDGYPPPGEDVRRALTWLALAAPGTAARCPRLLELCGPQARATVLALASATPASAFAPQHAGQASSAVGVKGAADLLGISPQAVRLAAAKGSLTATKHPATGEWRFSVADVEAYRMARQGRAAA
jgi:hypothetical protein